MPSADDLPEDIRLLARRNGIQLRPEQWREGVERLLKEFNPVMGVIHSHRCGMIANTLEGNR